MAIFVRGLRAPQFKTMDVDGYTVQGGAGRDPADIGKFHLNGQFLFDSADECKRWMERNGIPTLIFERRGNHE